MLLVEAEGGGERRSPKPLACSSELIRVHGGDEVLEVPVADDEPLEPVRVRAALDPRPASRAVTCRNSRISSWAIENSAADRGLNTTAATPLGFS